MLPLPCALLFSLVACGDDSGADGSSGATTVSASPAVDAVEDGVFPITIEHKYGSTEITAPPERVISVGFADQDVLLALGVIPIAIRDWYGDQPFATWPWAQDELGDAEPEVLPADALNFEQIASLQPDLIIGMSSGMTDTEYATLAKIAPTIAQPREYIDYGVPWDVSTQIIGDAVGKSATAAQVIDDVKGQIEAARAANPAFEGATAGVDYYFDNQPGSYASQDSRSRMMSDLGFVIPEEFDELAGDQFYFSVSNEEVSTLDTDVVVWIVSTDEDIAAIRAIPLRPSMRAYAEGREVVTNALLSGAFSFTSPLSIPFLLEHLVPELALAVDGEPGTVVPSAEQIAA